MSLKLTTVFAAVVCLSLLAQHAAAQSDSSIHATVSGLVSFQPKGYDGTGGPYIDNSLAGTVAGAAIELGVSPKRAPLLAVELSSTLPMKVIQQGRFVIGGGPLEARHRDTLLSLLTGVRLGNARVAVEPKAGLSLLFGTPERESHDYEDPAGQYTFTVGLDAALRASDAVDVVPTFRYSFASRGDKAFVFGLGDHIVRAGVGVRFRFGG